MILIGMLLLVAVGHGKSEGVRVHVDSVDDYVSDVLNHVQLMKEEHPQIPSFAIGHSMVSNHVFTAPNRPITRTLYRTLIYGQMMSNSTHMCWWLPALFMLYTMIFKINH